MGTDWSRTLATGGVTLVALAVIAVADYLDTDGFDELPPGAWLYPVGVVGVVLGLAVANAVFPTSG